MIGICGDSVEDVARWYGLEAMAQKMIERLKIVTAL